MSGHPLKETLTRQPDARLPEAWTKRWQSQTSFSLPDAWLDDLSHWDGIPRRAEITAKNRETLAVALQDYL